MQFKCFILHTDPGFIKMASLIEKHPRLILMPVEHELDAVSRRTFPTDFNPDITFIEYHTYHNHYDHIYTLIKKSNMVILVRHDKELPFEPLGEVDFRIGFITNNKKMCSWISLFITMFEGSIYHIPKFKTTFEKIKGLKKKSLIEIAVEDIVSIRIKNGICYFGLVDRTVLSSHTWAEIYKLYRNDCFRQLSEEIVVNVNHCDGFCMDMIRLSNGENYQIGNRFRLNFWEEYIQPGFLSGEGDRIRWNTFFRSTDEGYTSKIRNECIDENEIILNN